MARPVTTQGTQRVVGSQMARYSELAGERRSFLLLGDAQGDQQDWVELKHKTLLNRQQSRLIERRIRQRTPSQRKNLPPSPRTSALPWPGMGRLAFGPSKCTYTTLSIRQTDLGEREREARGVVDMLDACRIAEWRERVNQTGPASALPAFKTGRQRTRPFKLCTNRPRQRLASDPGK